MYYIVSNNAYGVKRYVIDTIDDIASIPLLTSTAPGSTAFITETSTIYVLNNNMEWVKEKKNPDEVDPTDPETVYSGQNINYENKKVEVNYDGGEL